MKENDYILIMNCLKKINESSIQIRYNKNDELSIIKHKIYKLENEIQVLKGIEEEIEA